MFNPLWGRLGAGTVGTATAAGTAAGAAGAGAGLMGLLGGPVGVGLMALQALPAIAGLFQDEPEPPKPGYRPSPFLNRQEQQRRPVRGYEGRNLVDILSLMGRR